MTVRVAVIPLSITERLSFAIVVKTQVTWTATGTCPVRECQEELGIVVSKSDLVFKHLVYVKQAELDYVYIYFLVTAYQGQPVIREVDKCSELGWFPLANLPASFIPIHEKNLSKIHQNMTYSEH